MGQFLTLILVIAVFIHLLYWVILFIRIETNSNTPEKSHHSVLVCYKNEAIRLSGLVDIMLRQKLKELILVDDFSSDLSASIAADVVDPRIVNIGASQDIPGKKNALLTGVMISSNEDIILTDADCTPSSDDWSALMTNNLSGFDVILGYAPMTKMKGWIPKFARYETYLTAIQYLSFAKAGMPYMGVGRNMGIKKSIALPILQELQNDGLASGDDDLLIQRLSGKSKVKVYINPNAFVYSDPAQNLKQFIGQKSRHISTSFEYKLLHKVLLGLFAGTHIAAYALMILILCLHPDMWRTLALIFIVKWAIQMIINWKAMNVLKERDLWLSFPVFDVATFVYYILLTPYLVFKNKKTWNRY